MKDSLECNFDQWEAILKKLRSLDGTEVEVGYYQEQSHPTSELSLSQIAYINELGSTKNNIPARPFMFQSFIKMSDKDYVKDFLRNVTYLKKPLRSSLNTLGEEYTDVIKDTIEMGNFVGNSPATIAKKGSNAPLIDTPYLKDNAKFKIKESGNG